MAAGAPKSTRTPDWSAMCFRFDYDPLPDGSAMQALERGEASPEQQKRCLQVFLHGAAMVSAEGWAPEPSAASFLAGRRYAGLCIAKLLKLNLAAFRRAAQNTTGARHA